MLLPGLAWPGDAGDVAAWAGAETALLVGVADGLAETGELGAN